MRLAFLRSLYEQDGPYASAYLVTDRRAEDAAKAVSLRWRHARSELGDLGADDATLDAIEAEVLDRGRAAPGRAVFATGGRVVLSAALPEPPQESVRFSALPDVMPMLERMPERVRHVQVRANRQGADIVTYGGQTRVDVETVQGSGWPIHKPRAGGWSEAQFQHGAEETWEHNADEVARHVAKEAAAVNAELIIIGGDVRARELVLEHLGEPFVERAVLAEHGARPPAGDEAAWEEEIRTAIGEHVSEHVNAVIARFREAYGRGDAVGGLAAVAEALRGGQVETLLVARPVRGELWYGPEPRQVAVGTADLRELGVPEPHAEVAGSVLARAAAGTDAELVFADDMDLPDRVGALLRYTVP